MLFGGTMKSKDIDRLADIVRTLCRRIEDPWEISRFQWLMIGLIELAREGKAFKALDVAFESNAYIAMEAEKARKQEKPAGTPFGIGTSAPSTPITFWTGYAQVKQESPKPVATIDQMRAAADAAMAHEDMVEWECDGCHKSVLLSEDDDNIRPAGWTSKLNENTGEPLYFCNECTNFGTHGSKQDDEPAHGMTDHELLVYLRDQFNEPAIDVERWSNGTFRLSVTGKSMDENYINDEFAWGATFREAMMDCIRRHGVKMKREQKQ
jgi:hypothetical protein